MRPLPSLSPRISELYRRVEAGELTAAEDFWHRLAREGTPLLEELEADTHCLLLTLVWRAEHPVRNVLVVPGLEEAWNPERNLMEQVPGTFLWHRTWQVQRDLRTTYCFSPDDPLCVLHELKPEQEARYFEERMRAWVPDPLNPRRFSPNPALPPMSVIELPQAPGQRWSEPLAHLAQGRLEEHLFQQASRGWERTFWLYRSPDFESAQAPALLVLCDGEGHLELGVTDVLDKLSASGRMPPLACILLSHSDRNLELPCHDAFVEELAQGLVPRVRNALRLSSDPARTVIGGWSYGGLAAAFAGLRHPEVFGNVLSQSGSFWWAPEGAGEHEWLCAQFAAAPRRALRFYLNVGLLECGPSPSNSPSQLAANRHLRDVLRAQGYDVTFRELNGGHDYLGWPAGLADGLLCLLGQEA